MNFEHVVQRVGEAVELLGITVIVVGLVGALIVLIGRRLPHHDTAEAYERARRAIGRSILLGLEVLVAGDIIRTVAVSPTFTSVGVLAGIVAIRTFLSFTLELEISGRWPWQKQPVG